ncbi:glycolate oxidase subunit GlcE [Methylotuvimicrobium sp. KM2]|uniref:glycolate oxidase subunit GlcE n=1 Tax=Methylotuvimicrobium sp. KM2 TaxID=3133976 RepID=UPI003100EBA8
MEAIVEQLTECVVNANENKQALCIRGGGSKDFYGNPQGLHDSKLETGPYRGIVDYDPTELVVSARAGTPLLELENLLNEHGQMLAFEPPDFNGAATLGGCIAAGLSGPRRGYAGAARDFVLGVKLLDGRGRILNFGGRVMKNVAGYDVSRLMTGAMGTLGVILEASLKVLPKPETERTLCFELPVEQALETMRRCAGQTLPISATCHIDRRLYIRLSGIESAVDAAHVKLGGDEFGGNLSFWESIKDQTHPFFRDNKRLWRLSVKPTAPPFSITCEQAIEWGGALRWFAAAKDYDATAVRAQAEKAGGHATLFRGKDPNIPAFHPLPPALLNIHRRLKRQFDPAGIFNPQRLFPEF